MEVLLRVVGLKNGDFAKYGKKILRHRRCGRENPACTRQNGAKPYQVAGVFRDYPANSHLFIQLPCVLFLHWYNGLRSFGNTDDPANTAWGWYDFYIYLQLRPGTNLQALQAKLPAFAERHINSRQLKPTT